MCSNSPGIRGRITQQVPDTIVAIATAPGEGGVAIVRISGISSRAIQEQIFRPNSQGALMSHKLTLGLLVDPQTEEVYDECLAVYMQAPHSYTCEDVVEFQIHGSYILAQDIVQLCVRLGACLAKPGEFTLRAFLNGRIDLAQAEAVASLIQAKDKASARFSATGLVGRFSEKVEELRQMLLRWLSILEAEIDFGDEVTSLTTEENQQFLLNSQTLLQDLLAGTHTGKLINQGLRTVIIGKPNAGKSTLLNVLLGESRAIVSPYAGTTRDTIEESISLNGVHLRLVDTAGLRSETIDPIEKMGIERSLSQLDNAELIIWVIDGTDTLDCELLDDIKSRLEDKSRCLVFINKSDLDGAKALLDNNGLLEPFSEYIIGNLIDSKESDKVVQKITSLAKNLIGDRVGGFGWNERQLAALALVKEALVEVESALNSDLSSEFLCLDLKKAVEALSELLGVSVTEEVLDGIFSEFCLGK